MILLHQPSGQDVVGALLQTFFFLTLLLVYMDTKIIRDQYGRQTLDDIVHRIGRRVTIAVSVFIGLTGLTLALNIRWLSALFFALFVSCAFLAIYARDLGILAYLTAVIFPIVSIAFLPSRSMIDLSLYSVLPAAISLLVIDWIVRDEAKAMKLPSIREALRAGLHLRIYPPAFLLSSLVLLLYLGIFIPEYYGLSGQEWILTEFMVMMWLLIYYLLSLYSALVATLVMYTYFALGLRLFWNIDILLYLLLFVILSPTLVTMRYVRKPLSTLPTKTSGTTHGKSS
jgi:hypothetical protein